MLIKKRRLIKESKCGLSARSPLIYTYKRRRKKKEKKHTEILTKYNSL